MAILIAFYSRAGENYFGSAYRKISVGNTEKAALMLAELTGGELYKIEQANPYSDNYKTCIAEAKADLQDKARPDVYKRQVRHRARQNHGTKRHHGSASQRFTKDFPRIHGGENHSGNAHGGKHYLSFSREIREEA